MGESEWQSIFELPAFLSAVAAVHLARIFDHIVSHFSDPELSLFKIAQSMRISPRYVQRLLQTSGTSFVAHVNELRLKGAYMSLKGQPGEKVRISDIAFQSGFSDVSYFNRLFRSRFGHSPSDVRDTSRRSLN